jgi:hypothetical protein
MNEVDAMSARNLRKKDVQVPAPNVTAVDLVSYNERSINKDITNVN